MANSGGMGDAIVGQYNQRNPAVKRLMREAAEMASSVEGYDIHAQPLEDNLFEWHFTFRGPPDTVYSLGVYHGRVILPSQYPLSPPEIAILTPNGRFETGTKICLSISSHHPETWLPSWSIRTAITALRVFMTLDNPGAIGSMQCSDSARLQLATESLLYKCPCCGNTAQLLKLKPETSGAGTSKPGTSCPPTPVSDTSCPRTSVPDTPLSASPITSSVSDTPCPLDEYPAILIGDGPNQIKMYENTNVNHTEPALKKKTGLLRRYFGKKVKVHPESKDEAAAASSYKRTLEQPVAEKKAEAPELAKEDVPTLSMYDDALDTSQVSFSEPILHSTPIENSACSLEVLEEICLQNSDLNDDASSTLNFDIKPSDFKEEAEQLQDGGLVSAISRTFQKENESIGVESSLGTNSNNSLCLNILIIILINAIIILAGAAVVTRIR